MSEEKRELLEKLKFELAFVEDGGYGRSVRTPHKSTSPFQDSLTCLNFGDPSRTHPCAECILMRYVPESRKDEDVPCHHIPLDQESRTIATLDATEAEEVLKRWLRHEIGRARRRALFGRIHAGGDGRRTARGYAGAVGAVPAISDRASWRASL